jgi:hypothetical protein
MVDKRLDARYAPIGFIGHGSFFFGLVIVFWFAASMMPGPKWLSAAYYALAAIMSIGALGFAWRLLTYSRKIVLSLDAAGLRDARVMPALIPWSAIESVSLYVPTKSKTPTGVEFWIVPDFRQNISMRRGNRLFSGASLGQRVLHLDSGVLDVDYNELLRVANVYLSCSRARSHASAARASASPDSP